MNEQNQIARSTKLAQELKEVEQEMQALSGAHSLGAQLLSSFLFGGFFLGMIIFHPIMRAIYITVTALGFGIYETLSSKELVLMRMVAFLIGWVATYQYKRFDKTEDRDKYKLLKERKDELKRRHRVQLGIEREEAKKRLQGALSIEPTSQGGDITKVVEPQEEEHL